VRDDGDDAAHAQSHELLGGRGWKTHARELDETRRRAAESKTRIAQVDAGRVEKDLESEE
jgi:hypothetical protein